MKPPSYNTDTDNCLMEISHENNTGRYAKEGDYEPTYKLSNSLYLGDSFLHIQEYITDTTRYYNDNQSLPFLENIRIYSAFHVVLLVFVSFLSVIIIILSIIALKVTP